VGQRDKNGGSFVVIALPEIERALQILGECLARRSLGHFEGVCDSLFYFVSQAIRSQGLAGCEQGVLLPWCQPALRPKRVEKATLPRRCRAFAIVVLCRAVTGCLGCRIRIKAACQVAQCEQG